MQLIKIQGRSFFNNLLHVSASTELHDPVFSPLSHQDWLWEECSHYSLMRQLWLLRQCECWSQQDTSFSCASISPSLKWGWYCSTYLAGLNAWNSSLTSPMNHWGPILNPKAESKTQSKPLHFYWFCKETMKPWFSNTEVKGEHTKDQNPESLAKANP